jgi:hypothetical protein
MAYDLDGTGTPRQIKAWWQQVTATWSYSRRRGAAAIMAYQGWRYYRAAQTPSAFRRNEQLARAAGGEQKGDRHGRAIVAAT